ncbi:MAG: hypothetical protein V9G08_00075 [Dermatophilaceae bacterium]
MSITANDSITQIDPKVDHELSQAALEAAIPSLTEKLKALKGDLNQDEQAILHSIVASAARHLETLQEANDKAEYLYMKPISAHASGVVRSRMLALPDELGFPYED